MFVVDGTPRPAAYVAAQIYQVWIEDATSSLIKTFFTERPYIPPNKRDQVALKTRLYCEAAALRVLLTEKQNDVRYSGWVREFEKLIFTSSPISEGTAKLEAVKSAMKNIDELISEKKS